MVPERRWTHAFAVLFTYCIRTHRACWLCMTFKNSNLTEKLGVFSSTRPSDQEKAPLTGRPSPRSARHQVLAELRVSKRRNVSSHCCSDVLTPSIDRALTSYIKKLFFNVVEGPGYPLQ